MTENDERQEFLQKVVFIQKLFAKVEIFNFRRITIYPFEPRHLPCSYVTHSVVELYMDEVILFCIEYEFDFIIIDSGFK